MMPAEIINGKELANKLRIHMKKEVNHLKENGLTPHLTVILVGDNPASKSYVRAKKKASCEIGISSEVIEFPFRTSEKELLKLINQLNDDNRVHGILVQLPLPPHIREQSIIETINPKKDVDGFHPINIGKMILGEDTFLPCTPYGILTMLKSKSIDLEGKHVVVIGRS